VTPRRENKRTIKEEYSIPAEGPTKQQMRMRARPSTTSDSQGKQELKPQFTISEQVLYHSTSAQTWIHATVESCNRDGTVNLDIKPNAAASKIMRYPDEEKIDFGELETLKGDLGRLNKELLETQSEHKALLIHAEETKNDLTSRMKNLENELRLAREKNKQLKTQSRRQKFRL